MLKLTINGSWTQFVEPLQSRKPFSTHGALRGDTGNYLPYGDRLPSDWRKTFVARSHVIDYVVYSYATPIAWHDTEAGWIVPNVSYSVITSKHQGRIRPAISEIGGYTE